jgi:hypothetical protein
MAESLSYAQSLRVVGQDLDALGVDSFELAKCGDDYIVWPAEFPRKPSAKKGFLSKITQKIVEHDDSNEEIPDRLHFAPADILWSDIQRRLKRQSDSPSDRRDLSFVLRVLGDYLDRKNAGQFTISCFNNSITIGYDDKQESLTSENLYDFGIRMYLRRSSRARPVPDARRFQSIH